MAQFGFAPQQRTDSAIGRGERSAVSVCLMELREACAEWPAEVPPSNRERKPFKSLVKTSEIPRWRIVVMDMQSTRL
jgi:hypothetical protein